MLDALRFVASAVAKKDFVPELTHFRIVNERITGFNGVYALSSDIGVDLDVMPHALSFITAIRACAGEIALTLTPAGKLTVRSGKFRSHVNCLPPDDTQFSIKPDGDEFDPGEYFLEGIKTLAPLMGIDASRPWSMGIRMSGQALFTTNNVLLAQYWIGVQSPVDIVIPAAAIEELLRIDEKPTRIQVTQNSISFWFGETRWMRTALIDSSAWPDTQIDKILNMPNTSFYPLADEFGEHVDKLKAFLEERGTLYLTKEGISTSLDPNVGTSIDVKIPGFDVLDGPQAYHQKNLSLLAMVADKIDWSTYPYPCKFFGGERLRGAIIGQRVS